MLLLLTLLFFTARLSGDPITFLVGGFLSKADIDKLKTAYGLNQPLPSSTACFCCTRCTSTSASRSGHTSRAAADPAQAAVSAGAVILALVLSVVLSVPLGMLAALKRGRAPDSVTMGVAVVGQAVPSFFLAVLLIYLFGVKLQWLPVFGTGGIRHLILPIVTLMGYPLARYTRLVRAQVSETMTLDYVRTARAKGLSRGASSSTMP